MSVYQSYSISCVDPHAVLLASQSKTIEQLQKDVEELKQKLSETNEKLMRWDAWFSRPGSKYSKELFKDAPGVED